MTASYNESSSRKSLFSRFVIINVIQFSDKKIGSYGNEIIFLKYKTKNAVGVVDLEPRDLKSCIHGCLTEISNSRNKQHQQDDSIFVDASP